MEPSKSLWTIHLSKEQEIPCRARRHPVASSPTPRSSSGIPTVGGRTALTTAPLILGWWLRSSTSSIPGHQCRDRPHGVSCLWRRTPVRRFSRRLRGDRGPGRSRLGGRVGRMRALRPDDGQRPTVRGVSNGPCRGCGRSRRADDLVSNEIPPEGWPRSHAISRAPRRCMSPPKAVMRRSCSD